MSTKLVVVGGGKMGEALISGVLRARWARARDVTVVEPVESRRAQLQAAHPDVVVTTEVPARSEGAVIAVKPVDVADAGAAVAAAKPKRVLSIAAGVTLAQLEEVLGDVPVLRAMPNTPALVGAGATAIAAGGHATEADLLAARRIFDSVGTTVVLEETQLDAVTGLSGSGPAYIFLIIEALSDAGVKVGLSRYTAQALAAQTVLGSAKLLIDTKEHPGRLKDMVTSPGGTAIAGLHTLEAGGLRTTLMDAVEAATQRSRELGEMAAAALLRS